MDSTLTRVQDTWSGRADQWHAFIGEDGDDNRQNSSDKYIWEYAGDLKGLKVLDAGCGTGYLSMKLATAGADVVGVDLAPGMIEIAQSRVRPESTVKFHIDSITELKTIETSSIDLIVSNYVIMDSPNLDLTVKAFARVLKPGGRAILIFLHPCFDVDPQKDGKERIFKWTRSYFDESEQIQHWGNWKGDMILFHRPLSVYWREFKQNGLELLDFDEPKYFSKVHEYDVSFSIVFHLRKKHN